MAASRAMPAPLMPPPTTRTSSVSRPSAASASRRRATASAMLRILYLGRAPVHRLEDGVARAQVGARHEAEPAHQARAQVGDDVAVEVLEQEHVELLRAEHELHAGVVDDQLPVMDAGMALRHLPRAGEE